jgi:hypothetical protein
MKDQQHLSNCKYSSSVKTTYQNKLPKLLKTSILGIEFAMVTQFLPPETWSCQSNFDLKEWIKYPNTIKQTNQCL